MTRMIGWAIIHSIWQAGMIAALTAAVLFALRRSSAAARYLVAVGGLVVMGIAPVVTVRLTHASALSQTPPAVESNGSFGKAEAPGQTDVGNEAPMSAKRSARLSGGSSTLTSSSTRATIGNRIEPLLPWVVVVWLVGVFFFSLRTFTGYIWARRLVQRGTRSVSDHLRGVAARIADSVGVRVAVRVLESSRVTVPMVVGWLRPVILLPAAVLTGLTPQQIEAILAHELAHVRRNDYLVNLLQTVVEILYFYHPAAWWLSGRIREEREHACDELAVAACGGDRVFYSRVLLRVEESRGESSALAVAMSGGSLARRIHRLLGLQQAHLDIGPRWYAGVFTIAMALVSAGGLVDNGLPMVHEQQWVMSADTGKARPDTVIKYVGSGTLDQRWNWAEQQARTNGYSRYWVGYVIDGDEAGQTWFHFDRYTPVSLGDATMSGHIRMNGDFGTVRLPGVSLQKLIGDYEPYRIVVFTAYDRGRLARVHLASFVFPMNFGEAPVLWLGRATDAESVDRIVRLDALTRTADMQEDLAAAIGAHSDARAAVPVLERWAQDRSRAEDARREAVEGLEHFSSDHVLAVLSSIARQDAAEDVRAEAIESIGQLAVPAALDTLRSFVRSMQNERLVGEAVESLTDLPDGRGLPTLRAIIDDRTLSSDLRGRAVESLAQRSDSPDMLRTLAQYTNRADDQDVQRKAVEAMGEVAADDDARIAALVNVVEHHPDPEIQARAAEALGEVHAHEAAMAALSRIVRDHKNEDVRRRALEALSNFNEDDRAAKILIDIARTHPDDETRRRAVEFLGNLHEFPAFKEIAAIAFSNQTIDVRRKAVETFITGAESTDALTFARRVLDSDAPFDVRREVVEALASMDHEAGIPVIIEIARTDKDREIRKRAIEALIDSDDPRAIAALRKVQ